MKPNLKDVSLTAKALFETVGKAYAHIGTLVIGFGLGYQARNGQHHGFHPLVKYAPFAHVPVNLLSEIWIKEDTPKYRGAIIEGCVGATKGAGIGAAEFSIAFTAGYFYQDLELLIKQSYHLIK